MEHVKRKDKAPIGPETYRVVGLMLLALTCLRLGVAYTPLSPQPVKLPDGLKIIVAVLPEGGPGWQPIWVFGGAWLLLGVLCLLAVYLPRMHTVVYLASIFGASWWAGAYVASQILGGDNRAWTTATTYIVLIGFIALVGLMTRPLKTGDDDE
jgi:hypothetical protein